jgi:aspartyl-tRNA(Asn)/glutamyl-tRNA(Gln) amidotransferase subunit A
MNKLELTELGIKESRDLLNKKEISAAELTNAYIQKIEESSKLNAFIEKTFDRALLQALAADKVIGTEAQKALCGIPLGIKDLFCCKNIKTQAASDILRNFMPPYESTVTQKLWDEQAIMLGKLNMDEFAMGSSNETSTYGAAINPWKSTGSDESLTPGGSSGGSSAAVAANLCAGATGTDTGGSIRQPAAFTGIVGLKPTYGRCSRWGIIAFASSFDQAGPITKNVMDSAIMLKAMSGFDPLDSTSAKIEVPDYEQALGKDIKGLKIGLAKEYSLQKGNSEANRKLEYAISLLKDLGAEIVEVSLPHTEFALPTYYVLAPAEASSNLARYDGVRYGHRAKLETNDSIIELYEKTRSEGFGTEVKRRILIGTYVLSSGYYDAYYKRAQKVRSLIKNDFDQVFKKIDLILTPTTPTSAFPLGSKGTQDPVEMYMNDIFTVPANLAGLPALSLPVGLDELGLPLGVQLIGNSWQESLLLNTAFSLENALAFDYKPKNWWA